MPRKKTVTRKPTYGDAVRWIAFNDNEGMEYETPMDEHADIRGFLSTVMVADLFGANAARVATDIQRTRHGSGLFA